MPRLIDLPAASSVADANIMLVSQGGIARQATRGQVLAGALLVANNLGDVSDAVASRANLGLGPIAILNIGTGLEESGGTLRVQAGNYMPIAGGQFTGFMRMTRAFTVSAAGTVQGDATALAAQLNVITTAGANTGVILPAAGPIWVRNSGANTLKVYPPVGGAINGLGVNAAATLAVNGSVMLETDSGGQWYTF
jgi:hypothetical protein